MAFLMKKDAKIVVREMDMYAVRAGITGTMECMAGKAGNIYINDCGILEF